MTGYFPSLSLPYLIGILLLVIGNQAIQAQSGYIRRDTLPLPAVAEQFPYDLTKVSKKYKLPNDAQEISALSYLPKDTVVFVHDEAGELYFFSKEKEEIIYTFKFKKKGDFEGVEVLENATYALRSDGKIYEIRDYHNKDSSIRTYETFLNEQNDTEGLAYDPNSHSLLIACKASPDAQGNTFPGKRAIYQFDLNTYQLLPDPYLLISEAEIASRMDRKKQVFQPSGVAVHPISGDLYIIASVGQLLTVYSPDKQLKWVQKLDKDLFRHPEGICFSPKGNLYISNEGDGKKGNIIKVKYHP